MSDKIETEPPIVVVFEVVKEDPNAWRVHYPPDKKNYLYYPNKDLMPNKYQTHEVRYVGNASFVELVCECGGDKARTTHSDWCPKFSA